MTRRHAAALRGRSALLVVLVTLVAGCSGPSEDLEVNVSEFASDIVLGSTAAPTPLAPPSPLPPNALPLPRQPSPLGSLPQPPELPEPVPTGVPPVCPAADPLSAPKVVAPGEITLPPAPATYGFRNDGSFETSGANATKGRFPTSSTREVRDVVDHGDGSFGYDVRAVLGPTATVTTYLLTPGAGGGLFIAKVVTQEYAESVDPHDPRAEPTAESSFDPTPDLQLLAFPIQTGDEVATRGIDASTGQVLALRSVIQVKDRVDACGEFLDTQVAAIDGEIAACPTPPSEVPLPPPDAPACDLGGVNTAGDRESFSGEYRFATHLGGLVVQDSVSILSERAGGNVVRTNTATVNRVPDAAARPAPGSA